MKYFIDWKDQLEKAKDQSILLSVLFVLFLVIGLPKFRTKAYETEIDQSFRSIEIEEMKKEKVILPKKIDKKVNLVFDDDLSMNEDVIEITPGEMEMLIEKHLNEPAATQKYVYYESYPVLMKAAQPNYTRFAKRAEIEGVVVLEMLVLADGRVGDIKLVKSLEPGLDKNAIEAAKEFIFQPAQANGKAIECLIIQKIRFSLN